MNERLKADSELPQATHFQKRTGKLSKPKVFGKRR